MKRIHIFSFLTLLIGAILFSTPAESRMYDPAVGRFLQRDPLGYHDSINFYEYVGNNSINFTDAFGLYKETVHYYKTKQWALEEGFSLNVAHALGKANQSLDEGLTSPFLYPFSTQLHFQDRKDVVKAIHKAIDEGNLEKFGQSLHSLQDTFSHKGYSVWTFGHLFAGHEPDWYDPNKARDRSMEELSRYYIKKFYDSNLSSENNVCTEY